MPDTLKKKKDTNSLPVSLLLVVSVIFFLLSQSHRDSSRAQSIIEMHYGFTLPAEIQVSLFAGDRHLASNIQFIVASTNYMAGDTSVLEHQANAHRVVSELNPCHEDNFYFSNAFLSWGGLPEEGNHILEQSTACRIWDDIPPFFLSFNRYFFFRDIEGAQESMQLAIDRSHENKVALKRLYIALESEKFDDRKIALSFLEQERDQANDAELSKALQIRIDRLKGLIILDEAQVEFEHKFKRPLSNPKELIQNGILSSYPIDPLGIGYEFRDQAFHFSQLRLN